MCFLLSLPSLNYEFYEWKKSSVLLIDTSQGQEQSLGHTKSSLCVAVVIITCLPTVPCYFCPWWKNWGPEPPGDLLKMDMVHALARKARSPYRLPSALSKPQFNLAVLLLCCKMNNCLWVHSQAHYCFYITSRNLRQAKDIALSIFLRNSTFPSYMEPVLKAHFEDRSQSLIEDCLQWLYLHVRAGLR